VEEDFEPRATAAIREQFRPQPRQAEFALGQSVTTTIAEAYNSQEDANWPTTLVFDEDEVAEGPDAGLEFEFSPVRASRPQWICG
jgi:hypothetical protein